MHYFRKYKKVTQARHSDAHRIPALRKLRKKNPVRYIMKGNLETLLQKNPKAGTQAFICLAYKGTRLNTTEKSKNIKRASQEQLLQYKEMLNVFSIVEGSSFYLPTHKIAINSCF